MAEILFGDPFLKTQKLVKSLDQNVRVLHSLFLLNAKLRAI